jgi:hypothetical protein
VLGGLEILGITLPAQFLQPANLCGVLRDGVGQRLLRGTDGSPRLLFRPFGAADGRRDPRILCGDSALQRRDLGPDLLLLRCSGCQ